MNVDQIENYPNLITEVDVLREAIDQDMSVLGICLGAQLLAKALGGSVHRNPQREIGWYDINLTSAGAADPVLSAFTQRQQVFQWHEDGIKLPEDAVHLASSPASDVQDNFDPISIREQTGHSIDALQALSRRTFSRWIERFELTPRRRTLPSR
jgi:GMP synthase-like glutamine amidotransferase